MLLKTIQQVLQWKSLTENLVKHLTIYASAVWVCKKYNIHVEQLYISCIGEYVQSGDCKMGKGQFNY